MPAGIWFLSQFHPISFQIETFRTVLPKVWYAYPRGMGRVWWWVRAAFGFVGINKGLITRIQTVAQNVISTYFCIHREALATHKMPTNLQKVVDENVKIINYFECTTFFLKYMKKWKVVILSFFFTSMFVGYLEGKF